MPDLISPKIRAVPSCIPSMPVYYETFSARNFNTSPLTISGLKGDSYDYTIVIWGKSLGSVANLVLYPNSDTTTNYRLYHMSGGSSSASAYTSDAWATGIFFDLGWSASTANLAICTIAGSSGDERYFSSLYSCGHTTKYIRKASQYWKNTADELTSLQFKGSVNTTYDATIALFAEPKDLSENWTLVEELSWTSETTEKTFSGLDGDVEKEYLIEWRGDQSLNVEPNNDGGTNYIRQYIANSGGTLSAANTTSFTAFRITDNSNLLIHAESGVKRLAVSEGSRQGTAIEQFHPSFWWSNTADNITSLACAPFASGSGTAKLWKKKNPDTVADPFNLPFKQLAEINVNGLMNSANRAKFTNLSGDKCLLIKVEGHFETGINTVSNSALRMEINNDTGSNYVNQRLEGISSSVFAASNTKAFSEVIHNVSATKVAKFTMFIYPKSGNNRPVLIYSSGNENVLEEIAVWWANSVDELTDLDFYTGGSSTVVGTLKLSYIPLPE